MLDQVSCLFTHTSTSSRAMSSCRILLLISILQLPLLASACSPGFISNGAATASNFGSAISSFTNTYHLGPRLKCFFGELTLVFLAFDICPCSETGLFAGDVITDAINGVELITDGHTIWGTVSLVLICLPVALIGLFMLWILFNEIIEWIGKAKDWLTCCSISAGEEEKERRRRSWKITPDCNKISRGRDIAKTSQTQ